MFVLKSNNMKKIQFIMKKVAVLSLILIVLFTVNSCKKSNDPNVLGGDTNIPLTQKDSVTNLYFTVNGGTSLPGASIKVVSNDNGMVTYGATIDLNALPDSVVTLLGSMIPQLITFYNPKDVTWSISPSWVLTVQYKIKITSEGMQNYFIDGKPWTLRYADPVGTNYTVTRDNGQTFTATVTEKTGADDWPYSFWLNKTSKIEYEAPAADLVLSKVTFRVNHKFGLVYVKAVDKDGKEVEVDLISYFML